ncbi:flagellin [Stenotrophomonas maltophilia]|uniref:flagellin n=1 Tax=Stenotrophomonas maltophilia TaxID=40324 RepID=UPI0013DC383E|nr:flagellin [Stenotrophomonas maltophilia]
MAQVINTNTMSLNAQRNLSSSGSSLATTIQRLSSGSRINSAKDDAAGLAISERFGTQIRGTDVAIRNANDGISLAQVAEGSLNEIGNNLQRIRELAVQSSNATNSASDRKALQSEVNQLVSEIDRVAKQSDFNGTKLLDGSFSSQLFQVGANAGQAIAIDKITNAKTDSLGGTLFAGATYTGAAETADETATGSGVYAYDGDTLADFTITANGKSVTFSGVEFEGGSGSSAVLAGVASQVAKGNAVASAINQKTAELGVSAEVDETGKVTLSSWKEGKVGDQITAAGVTLANNAALVATDAKHAADLKVTSYGESQQALQIVDKALESINSTRADLGAIQNRFTSVVANLQTSTENLSASRSRIKDTDFAKETAELTRTQILQQAGTAMLAQANQVPQNVLSLLR